MATTGTKTSAAKKAAAAYAPELAVADALKGPKSGAYPGGKAGPGPGALHGPNNALLAEFLICFTVLGIGTVVPTPAGKPAEGVPHLMVKGSALSLLFLILALTSAGGQRSRRAATGLGALVTVGYVVAGSDAYNIASWIGQYYSRPGTPGAGVPTAAAQAASYVDQPSQAPYPWETGAPPAAAGPPSAQDRAY
jgi:hypothetical protein